MMEIEPVIPGASNVPRETQLDWRTVDPLHAGQGGAHRTRLETSGRASRGGGGGSAMQRDDTGAIDLRVIAVVSGARGIASDEWSSRAIARLLVEEPALDLAAAAVDCDCRSAIPLVASVLVHSRWCRARSTSTTSARHAGEIERAQATVAPGRRRSLAR